jgi:hypothetical protein
MVQSVRLARVKQNLLLDAGDFVHGLVLARIHFERNIIDKVRQSDRDPVSLARHRG